MKRLLAILLLLSGCAWAQSVMFPGPGLFGTPATSYVVNAFVDFESGNNGDAISTANINAHDSVCTWETLGTGTQQTISTTWAKILPASVSVDGTTYTGNPSTRSFKYDPGGSTNQMSVRCTLGGSPNDVSVAGHYRTTSTDANPLSILFGLVDAGGHFVVSHWGNGASPGIHIQNGDTCAPSTVIPIAASTDYWVGTLWQHSGTFRLYAWETSTWTLAGACTIVASSASGPTYFVFGRYGADAQAGVGQWYFDDLIVDNTGKWPLSPHAVTVNAPTYAPDGGSVISGDTVTISDLVPEASMVYCTDTTGACTPSSSYTTPVAITVDGTHLRSKATATNWTDSAVKDSTYTLVSYPIYGQGKAATCTYNGTTCTVTLDSNPAAGSALVVAVGGFEWTTPTISSVADTCGTAGGGSNTYTSVNSNTAHGPVKAFTKYALVGYSKACAVTVTLSSAAGAWALAVTEVKNVNQSTPINTQAINYQASPATTTDAVTSGSVTSTQNNTYVYGVTFGSGGTYAAGTGFTSRLSGNNGSNVRVLTEEFVPLTPAGAKAATFTGSGTLTATVTAIIVFAHP